MSGEQATPGLEKKRMFWGYLLWYAFALLCALTLMCYLVAPLWIEVRTGIDHPVVVPVSIFRSFFHNLPIQYRAELLVVWTLLGVIAVLLFTRRMAKWREKKRLHQPLTDLHGSSHWATEQEVLQSGLMPPAVVERSMKSLKRRFVYELLKFPMLQGVRARLPENVQSWLALFAPEHRTPQHEGVFVSAWVHRGRVFYLRDNGPSHVLLLAPTRTGKGVSAVLPTLLTWQESVLVHDMKGEAWALSAGWRKSIGQRVFKIDPSSNDDDVARFNPLEEIRIGTTHEIADAQNIAMIIVDPEGKGLDAGQDGGHWKRTSFALLTAVILHVCYVARRERRQNPNRNSCGNLSEVERWFTDNAGKKSGQIKTFKERLLEMAAYPHMEARRADAHGQVKGVPHEYVAAEASAFVQKADKEAAGIQSSAHAAVQLFREPLIAKNTSSSDFKIRDVMHGDRPCSVYLVIRPSDAKRLRPLLRMIVTQFLTLLVEKMEFDEGETTRSYRYRLLLMLDEFAALQRLEILEEALPYLGGYGIKAYLVVQDIEQIINHYGRNESISSQCGLRVAFAPNKIETAERLSKMAGTTTVRKKTTSKGGGKSGRGGSSVSHSFSEERRDLIQPAEVMQLPLAKKNERGEIVEGGDTLIFIPGKPPIRGRQSLFFQNPILLERSKIPPPDSRELVEESIESAENTELTKKTPHHQVNGERKRQRVRIRQIDCDETLYLTLADKGQVQTGGAAVVDIGLDTGAAMEIDA